jgi:transcriptional regulator with XRE-family HTH domain
VHPAREETILQRRIGRAIWHRRLLRCLTRSALAHALGIEAAQLAAYETGSYAISAARLVRVARILEVPVFGLFEPVPVTAAQDPLSRTGEGGP